MAEKSAFAIYDQVQSRNLDSPPKVRGRIPSTGRGKEKKQNREDGLGEAKWGAKSGAELHTEK